MSSRNFITVVWTSLLLAFSSTQVCSANDAVIHPAHLANADLQAVERLIAANADVNARHISVTPSCYRQCRHGLHWPAYAQRQDLFCRAVERDRSLTYC